MLNAMSGLGEAPYSSRVYRRTRRVYEYILVLYIFFTLGVNQKVGS